MTEQRSDAEAGIGQADETIPEYFTGISAQMPYPRHTRLISI